MMCFGQSKPSEYEVGGVRHVNDKRLCMASPMKGIIHFQIEDVDVDWLVWLFTGSKLGGLK